MTTSAGATARPVGGRSSASRAARLTRPATPRRPGRPAPTGGFTLVELLVVVGIIGLLASMLVPSLTKAQELANQTVCMGNLSGVGKAIVLYKNQYAEKWPWIHNVRSDWSAILTGTDRRLDPYRDPNDGGQRSITALMFLMVRDGQNPGLFVCPSDRNASPETETRWDHDNKEDTEDVYYWDFSSDAHVSYSWQAPYFTGKVFKNGASDKENEAAVMADKTPMYDDPSWQPADMSRYLPPDEIRRNMSQNHDGGRKVNALMVALNVVRKDRPDFAAGRDNVYTASDSKRRGSQRATERSIRKHLTPVDSFLIGPIGEGGAGGGAGGHP